jgi:LysM repeat protein
MQRIGSALLLILVVVSMILAGCGAPEPTPTPSPPSPTPTATAEPISLVTATPTGAASVTPEGTATATPCVLPAGWVRYRVEAGDTLSSIAARYGLNTQDLQQANCLRSADEIQEGQLLFVPYALPTSTPCAIAEGWFTYEVQAGETLFGIAARCNLTAGQLAQANCLQSDSIQAGQRLVVPCKIAPPCDKRTDWPVYTVQQGDTLYGLALRHGVSVALLQEANCLDTDTIQVGQSLHVPSLIVATPRLAAAGPTPTHLIATPGSPAATRTPIPPSACGIPTWLTYTTGVASARYVVGKLDIAVDAPNTWTTTTANCTFDDVLVGVHAQLASGSPTSGYGLVCRYHQDEAGEDYYAFLVNSQRQYAIVKMEDSVPHYLLNWRESSLLDPTFNRLALYCQGSLLQPWANNQCLLSTTDSTLTGGYIGLVVATFDEAQATVSFSDGRAAKPPPPPLCPAESSERPHNWPELSNLTGREQEPTWACSGGF